MMKFMLPINRMEERLATNYEGLLLWRWIV